MLELFPRQWFPGTETSLSRRLRASYVCMCARVSPQVDPSNLPDTGPSEDYVPPEDVQFEQVWDPSVMLPSSEGATAPPDPGVLVAEFEGAVSHDKVGRNAKCGPGKGLVFFFVL